MSDINRFEYRRFRKSVSNYAGVSIDSALDPSSLRKLSEKALDKFKIAAKMLRLHPYDATEDESVYTEKPKKPDFAEPLRHGKGKETSIPAVKNGANKEETMVEDADRIKRFRHDKHEVAGLRKSSPSLRWVGMAERPRRRR